MSPRVRRIVVGLGNPGAAYEGTRHNVGFAVVDRVAHEAGLLFAPPAVLDGWAGPRQLLVARHDAHEALLAKPQTFMNRSGAVVAPLVAWAQLDPADLLVVYDDLDLPFAALRIRPHGGHGGHNGMRSILECLGTDRFPRLRVGIGNPRTDAARHVLERFTEDEAEDVAISTAEAADAISAWLRSGDLQGVMTRFHSRWTQGPA